MSITISEAKVTNHRLTIVFWPFVLFWNQISVNNVNRKNNENKEYQIIYNPPIILGYVSCNVVDDI